MASMLTAANKFWLGNISCIVDGVSGGIMNTYCWIQGTFTVPSQLTGRQGYDHPHPGVGPPTSDLRGPGTYPEKAGPLSSEELLIDNDPNLLGVSLSYFFLPCHWCCYMYHSLHQFDRRVFSYLPQVFQ